MGPEHAATIGSQGWSKRDVKRSLFDTIRRPARELVPGPDGAESGRLRDPAGSDPNALIPKFPSGEEIMVIVAGGAAGGVSGWGCWGGGWGGRHGVGARLPAFEGGGGGRCRGGAWDDRLRLDEQGRGRHPRAVRHARRDRVLAARHRVLQALRGRDGRAVRLPPGGISLHPLEREGRRALQEERGAPAENGHGRTEDQAR